MVTQTSTTDLGLIMAAIVSPMHSDETLNFERFDDLLEHYVQRGVEGIYCGGSSAEGLLLSLDEREQLVRRAVQTAAGRVPVVAHVGALRTADAIQMALAAESDGAAALSMIPPIYYSYSLKTVTEYYQAVMDATDLPMFVYNIPQFTGVDFSVDNASELLSDPRVIGVKQTAHNMFAFERMRRAFPDKTYLNGFDEVFLSSLAAGASGTIGTTVGIMIELFLDVRKRFNAGDIAGAQRVQTRINDVIASLVEIDVFPAAKYVAGRRIGDLGDCRQPFSKLSSTDKRALDELDEKIQEFIRLSKIGE